MYATVLANMNYSNICDVLNIYGNENVSYNLLFT